MPHPTRRTLLLAASGLLAGCTGPPQAPAAGGAVGTSSAGWRTRVMSFNMLTAASSTATRTSPTGRSRPTTARCRSS